MSASLDHVMANQFPEQVARDAIDRQLEQAGWRVQASDAIDFGAGSGIAVREYQTDVGPADYVLFADRRPVGVVEAKPESWGARLTTVEEQSGGYATAKLRWVKEGAPLPFVYESTGTVTRFTDGRDPDPRSREVFGFHRPETLKAWAHAERSLRGGIAALPSLPTEGLRDCQITAITNLEASLGNNRPRALVQMATGSGKTFTAITQVYRLLKHANARRVLFLVDTKNLGEQAEQEFRAFVPTDENRTFADLYNVQRLTSPRSPVSGEVVISTIQRMYATLKGEDLPEGAEDEALADRPPTRREPLPVAYSASIPLEHFDVIVIDECHRSIYGIWRQVIEYFDAFLIGLTATPDARTYGFFRKNVVSEYASGEHWTETPPSSPRPHLQPHLGAVHDDRGAEPADLGVGEEEPPGERFVVGHVTCEADEREVRLAGDVVALLNLRLGTHPAPEAVEYVDALALHLYQHEECHRPAERIGVEDRLFIRNHTGHAQASHTPLHSRGREPRVVRQVIERRPGIPLQGGEDEAVGRVEIGHCIVPLPAAIRSWSHIRMQETSDNPILRDG